MGGARLRYPPGTANRPRRCSLTFRTERWSGIWLLPNYWNVHAIMADLTDEQKLEIVAALACFRESAVINQHFQSEHGLQIDHKQVGRYDPNRSYYAGGDKWREIFDAKRKAYVEEVASVPIANQGYRINRLNEMASAALKEGKRAEAAMNLKQAAEEVGGAMTNRRDLRIEENRRPRPADMTPEERRSAMAELIRKAMEQAAERSGSVEKSAGVH